ncbi:MAG: hypothetical protein P0107_04895 [Nitrosomonas sp.]|nr:hypothetical protein [Nitrosomonas sp.]
MPASTASVIAVYELLPRYTGRPWKTNKPFYAAWFAICPWYGRISAPSHDGFSDAYLGTHHCTGAFFGSGLPVMVVTGYGALMIVYRSGIKWSTSAKLLFLSMFGWAGGVIPAHPGCNGYG